MLKHNGLTIALLVLIACLLICNITKFLFGQKASTVTAQPQLDRFSNVYNEINYFPSKCQQQPEYCPGQHPKIPCNMINKCGSGAGDDMDPAIQEYVDSYVYLISLLYSIKNYLPTGTV